MSMQIADDDRVQIEGQASRSSGHPRPHQPGTPFFSRWLLFVVKGSAILDRDG